MEPNDWEEVASTGPSCLIAGLFWANAVVLTNSAEAARAAAKAADFAGRVRGWIDVVVMLSIPVNGLQW